MIDQAFAQKFAEEWIEAWNSHNLDDVLSHYTEEFAMNSPVIVQMLGIPNGKITGKANVRNYWEAALTKFPSLHFELVSILKGVNSITLYYKGHRGFSAEVFFFNENGLVYEAFAHYE